MKKVKSNVQIKTLRQVEKEHIIKVMNLCAGNKEKGAKLLGIGRTTLYLKLREWDLLKEYRRAGGFAKGYLQAKAQEDE